MMKNEDGIILEDENEIAENDPDLKIWLHLLRSDVPPVKLGNTNKSGKCGMLWFMGKKVIPMQGHAG